MQSHTVAKKKSAKFRQKLGKLRRNFKKN